MNKKILMLVISILSLVLLSLPLIGTVGARPNGLSFDTTLTIGDATRFFEKLSPPADPNMIHFKNIEDMDEYTITIGTTTYNLNDDFIYEGENWGKSIPGVEATFHVRYSYNFSPAGIEGTLEMTAQLTLDMSTFTFTGWIKGHGTGQLRGAIVVAGPDGYTHTGMIYNWPL